MLFPVKILVDKTRLKYGKVKHELRVASSDIRVTSSKP